MYVRNNDANLFVDVRGKGANVVLLHGFPLTHAIWEAHSTALAPTHRIIAPDLRGMGSSSVVGGPYLMEVLAGDVAAALDALAIDRAIIVGHSLGGYVALAFARMFAERVSALALVCSRLSADSPQQAAARESLAVRLEADNSIEAAIETYLPQLLAAQTVERNPDLVDRVRAIARENNARGAAAMLRGMALRGDSVDIAPELRMPVLVVAGSADAVVPKDEVRAMAAAFSGARLEWCERSGHLPMLEEPDRFREMLTRFVREAASPSLSPSSGRD